MFPKIGKLVFSARKKMSDIFAANKQHHLMLLNRLKETLSPQMCRGVADAFLIRQQQLKVRMTVNPTMHCINLLSASIGRVGVSGRKL